MRFDSNLAWKEASAAVGANREVLLALAGVFFMLPSLAFALLFPQPDTPSGVTSEQAMAIASEYYASAMPFLLPMAILQGAGTLGLLALFTDRRRPTVGEAIRLGFIGLLPYIGSQLLLGIGIGVVAGILFAIAAATGIKALVAVSIPLLVVAVVYVAVKTSLTAPVIIVEGRRNPVAALKRSWLLTRGNSARLGLFYLLLGIAFVVVMTIIVAVVGVVAALLAGGEGARVVSAVVSSGLGAVMTLYFVAVIAAVHRQLAGPSAEAVSVTFD